MGYNNPMYNVHKNVGAYYTWECIIHESALYMRVHYTQERIIHESVLYMRAHYTWQNTVFHFQHR